ATDARRPRLSNAATAAYDIGLAVRPVVRGAQHGFGDDVPLHRVVELLPVRPRLEVQLRVERVEHEAVGVTTIGRAWPPVSDPPEIRDSVTRTAEGIDGIVRRHVLRDLAHV